MLQGVGQRFLHHAIGGEIAAHRQRILLALLAQLDGQAGVLGALDEVVEPCQRRLRLARRGALVAVAHQPEQAAQLAERLAPAALDLGERRDRVVGLGVQDAAGGARLDDHHRHGVCDHIVELARDPPALVGHGRGGLCLAFDLQALVAQRELARQERAVAQPARDRCGDREDDDGEDVVADGGAAALGAHDRHGGQQHDAHDRRGAVVERAGRAEDRDDEQQQRGEHVRDVGRGKAHQRDRDDERERELERAQRLEQEEQPDRGVEDQVDRDRAVALRAQRRLEQDRDGQDDAGDEVARLQLWPSGSGSRARRPHPPPRRRPAVSSPPNRAIRSRVPSRRTSASWSS